MGAKHGFSVEDAKIIDVHGGSLRVTFVLGDANVSDVKLSHILDAEAAYLNSRNILAKFNDFNIACSNLKNTIHALKNNGSSVAGYGCPARFSTITNFAGLTPADISFVVDDSPLKQNRFSPGMHIPIVSYNPNHKPDAYIVFAFEYISSIKAKVGKLSKGFYRPVPFVEI